MKNKNKIRGAGIIALMLFIAGLNIGAREAQGQELLEGSITQPREILITLSIIATILYLIIMFLMPLWWFIGFLVILILFIYEAIKTLFGADTEGAEYEE